MDSYGLQPLDWALIVIYAASTIALGFYFSRRQASTKEYFIGSGQMSPLLIGVSIFATLLSTISYLSMPGESAGKGPVNLLALLGYPVVYVIVAYGLLPVYMRNRVTSAYELLEERLGLGIRLLGASMFLLLRVVWMTLLVYLAAKAMIVMMGIEPKYIPLVVLITGAVSIVYTSLGGLRAVVVTDFMQTVLLFGGALMVIAMVTLDLGGFGWFPTRWQDNWDTQPFFSFDPKTRVTVVGTFLATTVWMVATVGGDQTAVQRFMSTSDVSSARRALAIQLIVGSTVAATLYLVGFALLGYFTAHPEYLAGISLAENADDLFPRYISYHLPVGISGLVVAAMFAAAMSSIDSGINSITAVVMTDFLDRLGMKAKDEKTHYRRAQFLALTVGVLVVTGSFSMKYIEGNITEVTGKTVNLLTTPIFALFLFALFVPFATTRGVVVGTACGATTGVLIAFSGPFVAFLATWFDVDPQVFNVQLKTMTDAATGAEWITAEDPISFQWIGPLALTVTMATGTLASWLTRKKDNGPAPSV